MAEMTLKDQIASQLDRLSPELQRQVLQYTEGLTSTVSAGRPASSLRKFAGTLDPESANQMREAIAEGCERVDPDGW